MTASIVPSPYRRWALALLLALSVAASGSALASEATDSIAAMVARVSPAVVRVSTVRPAAVVTASQSGSGPSAPGMSHASASAGTSMAHGSGYIIDPAGYVGTNRHVVEGATSVYVVTADGIRYPATIVGMPDQADIALLRIDPGRRQLPYVSFGDSEKVRVGDRVVAIGSPFGFDNTVTSGIISALNRDIMESPFDDYLQTDASINHGNSGGPLFNLAGEVIGMNSVIFSPAGSAGVGFALPATCLKFVYGRLMQTGRVGASTLAVQTQEVNWSLQQAFGLPDLHGAIIRSVRDDGGEMLRDKLLPGDVIRAFNGQEARDPRELARMAVMTPVGSDAVLSIYRGGHAETVHVTMQPVPEVAPVVLNNDGPRALGLELASRPEANRPPVVTVAAVDPDGTAADSGIQKGDIVLQVQQTSVTDPAQALRIMRARLSLRQRYTAVLVKRADKLYWLSLSVPE